MYDLTKDEKITFYHKTQRGNFKIEITEIEIEKRAAYQDIKIKFSINIKNEDYPDWKIRIADTRGRIGKMEDRERLVEKLKDEIIIRINKDAQGDYYIGESTLDLT